MSDTQASSQTSTVDLEKARKALKKFLQRLLDGDYRRAMRYTQISWLHMHTPDPEKALRQQMQVVILDGYTMTKFSVEDGIADSKVPEVFSDCMVDLPFEIQMRGPERGYAVTGTARLICERGYMKPSARGKWGVNPVSMARVHRRDLLSE